MQKISRSPLFCWHFDNTFQMTGQTSSLPIKVKFGEDSAEDKWRRSVYHYRSFIAQVVTHLEISPKTDKPCITPSSTENTWYYERTSMPCSILRISIWIFNTVFVKHVQKYWKPASFSFLFFSRALVAFFNLKSLNRSYFSARNEQKKRPGLNVFVIASTTPCQDFMSKIVKLRAASPILVNGCGRGLAGPACTDCKRGMYVTSTVRATSTSVGLYLV